MCDGVELGLMTQRWYRAMENGDQQALRIFELRSMLTRVLHALDNAPPELRHYIDAAAVREVLTPPGPAA